jgi:bacillithiol synthase
MMITEIEFGALRGPRLCRDYLDGRGDAGRFYVYGRHSDPAAFRGHAARIEPAFTVERRRRIASVLSPTSVRSAERLRRFVDEGGFVVTTGQQAGFLTGPLYTVYKALTAVRLAGQLESLLGRVVLPIFWCASEDHDWAEIDHAYLVSTRYRLHRLRAPSEERAAIPAAERTLGPGIESTFDELRQVLGAQGDGFALLDAVEQAYRPGATVADAFRTLLAVLLEPFDMLLTDAADPELKRLSRAVLSTEIRAADAHQARLRQRGAELVAAGYHEQVSLPNDGTNLFLRTPHGREKLERRGTEWRARESGLRLATDELLDIAETDPVRVTPNALLRPVVESAVFPTLAYVGGAAEISYFAQAQVLFAAHDVCMPVVVPRASVTLVPPAARRALGAIGLTQDELLAPFEELRARLVRRAIPAESTEALRALRAAIVEGFAAVGRAGGTADVEGIRLVLGRHRNQALLQVEEARRSVHRAVRLRNAARWRRLRRAKSLLAPLGVPQERTLNVLPFVLRDPTLLRRIADRLPPILASPGEDGP